MPLLQAQGRCTLKSSTRNLVNPQVIGADKRLQAVVKRQEAEHQHLLSSHNREMQELRDKLNIAIEKAASLSARNVADLKDFQEKTTHAMNLLKERVASNDTVITEQRKTLTALQDQLLNFQVLYPSMRDVDNLRKEMEKQVNEATKSHVCSLQDLQRQFKIDLTILRDVLGNFQEDAERRLSEQSNRIEERYNLNKMDREGVIREIRIREKEIFIIEKKIENIYTLIERINKKE